MYVGQVVSGTVVHVRDGDTIVVQTADNPHWPIRLYGVDTPETVKPHHKVDCYGPEASAYTKSQLSGRKVRIKVEPGHTFDRDVGIVYVSKRDFNTELVAGGFARVEPNFVVQAPLRNWWLKVQAKAKAAMVGLWEHCA